MAVEYLVKEEHLKSVADTIRMISNTADSIVFPNEFNTVINNTVAELNSTLSGLRTQLTTTSAELLETTSALTTLHSNVQTNFANARNWATTSPIQFNCVHFANGLWVSGSNAGIYYSTINSDSWYPTAISSKINAVCFSGNMWFAGSDSGIYFSSNGTTWNAGQFIPSDKIVSMVAACGVVIATSANGKVYRHDGNSWQHILTNSLAFSPAYANGQWVLGYYGGILVSTDNGVSWSAKATNWSSVTFKNFDYGNGVWVGSASGAIVYSSDRGNSWSVATVSSDVTAENSQFGAIYYADGMWIISSDPADNYVTAGTGLLYSTNGTNWYQTNIKAGRFSNISYNNGMWVAGSSNGYGLYYSMDGITWEQSNITSASTSGIAAGKSRWIAVGTGGSYRSNIWKSL